MTASTAELVQVRYQKLKNVSFEVMPITARQYHVHSSPEICLVLEGELTYTVNGATYLAGPGSLLLCNAYEVHCLEPQPSATVLFLHLAPGFGKDYFARMVNVEFDCDPTLITKAAHQQIVQPILAAATVYFGEPEAFGMECVGWICHAVTALLRNVPYRLNTDAEFEVSGEYVNRIVVRDGRVCIEDSDCPGSDCVHSGWIDKGGRSIVCLPNRVEIRISGESDVDFVVK